MSTLTLLATGTLVHRHSSAVGNKQLFDYTLQIEPTGRERKAKQLYLSTFSTTIAAELREAMEDKAGVTLLCEVTGQPGSEEGKGLNRIKPVKVWRADERSTCPACLREYLNRERVMNLWPNNAIACCPKCGAGDIIELERPKP